jgi:pilus assembly protein FimV
MTLPERTAVDVDRTPDAEESMVTAKADRRSEKQAAGAASESNADGTEQQAPIAVPKLVVRRNGEGGPHGARAAARKNAEEGRASQGAMASAPAGASGGVDVPSGDAAAERPRFPAPPLGTAAAPNAGGAVPQAAPVPKEGIAAATAPPEVTAPTAPTSPAQVATARPAPAAAPTATPPPPAAVASSPGTAPPALPSAAAPVQQPAAKPASTDSTPAPKPADAGLVAPTRANAAPSAPVAATAPKPAPKPVAKAAPPPPPVAPSVAATAGGPYTIQVGAFSSRANAEALVAKIRGNAPDGRIITSTADGKAVFRVVIGSFSSPAEAAPRSRDLAKAGLSTFVRRAN